MKDIPKFKIDEWVREYVPRTSINLHSSFAAAISLNELQKLAPDAGPVPIDHDLPLTYGNLRGSVRLRETIAAIHSSDKVKLEADDVIIMQGSISANHLVLSTLCGAGDHVICQYPTYGQLYLLPQYFGVDMKLWAPRVDEEWAWDVDELAASIQPNTKAIILNNPNNPTGSLLSDATLQRIIDIARKHDITILSDEVFSPLFYTEDKPSPIVSFGYPRSVSTGSLSKAYGLPGLRLGWIVSQDAELRRKIITARDFTTISVSQLDDAVGAFALRRGVRENIVDRSVAICRQSVDLLEEFVKRNAGRCRWVRPRGAGTAFIQFLGPDGEPLDEVALAAKLATEGGVSVIPGGHAFGDRAEGDFKGYIRITLGEPQRLPEGLSILETFLTN